MSRVMRLILLCAGVFICVCTIWVALISNYNFGNILSLAAGGFLILYGIFVPKIKVRPVKIVLNAAIAAMAVLIGFLAIYGNIDNTAYNENAVIVLGAGINGERITLPLYHRLTAAVSYYKKNPNAVILVSGGQGAGESISEAEAMRRFLVENGVSNDKIIKEDKSTTTRENFKFSKEILDGYFDENYTVCYITNSFHIYRAGVLARKNGFTAAHLHGITDWYTMPTNYIRECSAVLFTWIVVR